ncbi:MAG: MOSC domain-containing protein, partial [Casimicrobiaceae bacterium]
VLRCVKPCTRCQVTTTDQDSAQIGLEPLRTLGEYRMNEQLGGVTFGMNAIVVAGAGEPLTTGATATVEYRF